MNVRELWPSVRQLARCRRVIDVAGVAVSGARSAFGCHIATVFLLDDGSCANQLAHIGADDADIDEYLQTWRSADLVLSAALERAHPVYNWEIYRKGDVYPPIYTHFGRRLDTYNYVAAPIFGSFGSVRGFLNICRRERQPEFSDADLRMAGTFAGFLSATLARVGGQESRTPDRTVEGLAPREWQVARLAAAGRNNLEIALQLGLARDTVKHALRRVFRKLGVNGRAQMAARLASCGVLEP